MFFFLIQKAGKIYFDSIFYLPSIAKRFSFQQTVKMKNQCYILFFFILSLWNPVCILHVQCMSVPTSHITRARSPHSASSYRAGQSSSAWISGWHRAESAAKVWQDRQSVWVKSGPVLFPRGIKIWMLFAPTHCLVHPERYAHHDSFNHFPTDGHAWCFQFFHWYKNMLVNTLMCISCAHMQVLLCGNFPRIKSCILFYFNKHLKGWPDWLYNFSLLSAAYENIRFPHVLARAWQHQFFHFTGFFSIFFIITSLILCLIYDVFQHHKYFDLKICTSLDFK